jgi:hypothetical protein
VLNVTCISNRIDRSLITQARHSSQVQLLHDPIASRHHLPWQVVAPSGEPDPRALKPVNSFGWCCVLAPLRPTRKGGRSSRLRAQAAQASFLQKENRNTLVPDPKGSGGRQSHGRAVQPNL